MAITIKKRAIVYDKWLTSLGGGEIVACNMVKILYELGYEVTLVSGKLIPLSEVEKRLNLKLPKVNMIECWNDQTKLKTISKNKDLFINISFLDYSFGYAKRNIYYIHFPDRPKLSLNRLIIDNLILPIFIKFFKARELIKGKEVQIENHIGYCLNEPFKVSFSYLELNKITKLVFFIYLENFSKSMLESLDWEVAGAEITSKTIKVDHHSNSLKVSLFINPKKTTIYLQVFIKNLSDSKLRNSTFIIDPKIVPSILSFSKIISYLQNKFYNRLRAGIFTNFKYRLNSYQTFICHSKFVKRWIFKYWSKKAIVIYPPIELTDNKQKILNKEQNWICSVGRFFTLGHSKRQDILIKAYIKLYKSGITNWELHLAGGLGEEPSSIRYLESLKKMARGYPIFFHINASSEKILEIYQKSKIYWHAAGYGEQNKPIRLEHFGITVIEALSKRCIPILYNGGGLPEIIEILNLSKSRYLFNSIEELCDKTKQVILERNELIDWSVINEKLINNFSKKAFKKNFLRVIQS